jgi:hypothetical protein
MPDPSPMHIEAPAIHGKVPAYLNPKRATAMSRYPAMIDFLYPSGDDRTLEKTIVVVKPRAKKKYRLPATAWLRANSLSMMCKMGARIDLEEKLRYQRLQKFNRRNIFTLRGVYLFSITVP